MAKALQSTDATHSESRSHIWKRGGLMLAFAVCFGLAQTVLFFVTFGQFLWLAVTLRHNELLAGLGGSLSNWMADAGRYMTCRTEDKPFPWRAWPSA